MEVITHSTQKTKDLARKLAENLKPNDILALYGDLGSGKTTFTRFLVESLGFSSRVQSPTFVIARRYAKDSGNIKIVNHLDLYRLTSMEDLQEVGLEEFIAEKNAITIIEWPELIDNLPRKCKRLYFEYVDEDSRKIIFNE